MISDLMAQGHSGPHRPIKPRALRPGDLVAIASPSGPIQEETVAGMVRLLEEEWGFRVRLSPHICGQYGYLSGTDEERAADLNDVFSDPEVSAVIMSRGGFGAMRILPAIDLEPLRRHPKAIVGFSDITALHLALARIGLVSFHGPMADIAGKRRNDYGIQWLRKALTDPAPLGAVTNPPGGPPLTTLGGGRASGPLVGGNLSLVAATLGTPYEIETEGAILLLEDVDEEPYRVDRMLTQLWLGGKLQKARGILFGEPVDMDPKDDKPSLTLMEVLAHRLGSLGIPVLVGFAAGHGFYRATLPLGVGVTLDADAQELVVEESATL